MVQRQLYLQQIAELHLVGCIELWQLQNAKNVLADKYLVRSDILACNNNGNRSGSANIQVISG